MDFSSVTNLNAFARTNGLKAAWKQKSASAGALSAQNGASVGLMAGVKDEKNENLTAIINKMQAGGKLSSAELDYLRENAPQIYESAMAALREQKQYEEELARCETKEDARTLHMGKLSQLLSSLSGGSDAWSILARLTAFSETYGDFVNTAEYGALADTYAELADARAAEREPAVTEEPDVAQEDEPRAEQAEGQKQPRAQDVTAAPEGAAADKAAETAEQKKTAAAQKETAQAKPQAKLQTKPQLQPHKTPHAGVAALYAKVAKDTADGELRQHKARGAIEQEPG